MILITGGAYQGKLEYAMNEFAIKEDEVFVCAGPEIDLGAKVLTHFEKYVLACIKTGVDAREYIKRNIELLRDKGSLLVMVSYAFMLTYAPDI